MIVELWYKIPALGRTIIIVLCCLLVLAGINEDIEREAKVKANSKYEISSLSADDYQREHYASSYDISDNGLIIYVDNEFNMKYTYPLSRVTGIVELKNVKKN